jgi:hypothetical protein
MLMWYMYMYIYITQIKLITHIEPKAIFPHNVLFFLGHVVEVCIIILMSRRKKNQRDSYKPQRARFVSIAPEED